MAKDMKQPPAYAISSVDSALRLATALQLEGRLTVSEAAERLGVARSTAHRLLKMLVYRDFAVQDDSRVYRAGPVLELAAHSGSEVSRVRAVALPHLERLVAAMDESANLVVRTADTARFIASVECDQALRVGNREGMVFPAHSVSGGMVLLAELSETELESTYAVDEHAGQVSDQPGDRPDLPRLRKELRQVRKQGFAVNAGRSERGVVAIGCPVRDPDGTAVAGLSVSMPSVRYDRLRLPQIVGTLAAAARGIEEALAPRAGI